MPAAALVCIDFNEKSGQRNLPSGLQQFDIASTNGSDKVALPSACGTSRLVSGAPGAGASLTKWTRRQNFPSVHGRIELLPIVLT